MADDKNDDQRKVPGGGDPAKAGHGGGQGDTPAPKNASAYDYKNIPGNQT